MLTCYHCWIYENHKIESVEVLREWAIQEAEFQTKAIETIQGLSRKHDVRSNTRDLPHTLLISQIRVLDQSHQQNTEFVSYATSLMEYGLVVSIKEWKYRKDGSMLRNQNCAGVCAINRLPHWLRGKQIS